jgi:hypothetical protein
MHPIRTLICENLEIHRWMPLGVSADRPCFCGRKCLRCGIEATEEPHQWKQWEYSVDSSCIRRRSCERCHTSEVTTVEEHLWLEWAYSSNSSCQQERHCTRCPATEGRFDHASNWQNTSDFNQRSCARCQLQQARCYSCGGTGYYPLGFTYGGGDSAGGPHYSPGDMWIDAAPGACYCTDGWISIPDKGTSLPNFTLRSNT